MSGGTHFHVDDSRIIHETIDGEVIIVNVESGCYYSLSGVGADIWELIAQGSGIDEIAHAISQRYHGDYGTITESVRQFLTALREEGLITAAPGPSSAEGAVSEVPEAADEKQAFSAPVLNRYTDMQELLLLDPVHDLMALAGESDVE